MTVHGIELVISWDRHGPCNVTQSLPAPLQMDEASTSAEEQERHSSISSLTTEEWRKRCGRCQAGAQRAESSVPIRSDVFEFIHGMSKPRPSTSLFTAQE